MVPSGSINLRSALVPDKYVPGMQMTPFFCNVLFILHSLLRLLGGITFTSEGDDLGLVISGQSTLG